MYISVCTKQQVHTNIPLSFVWNAELMQVDYTFQSIHRMEGNFDSKKI